MRRPDHWRVLTPSRRSGLRCHPARGRPCPQRSWPGLLVGRAPAGRGPPGGGVRLDAGGAVILDGLSYRRAGRMVGICKSEVGDSLDLLLGELVALGVCQPDGTFVTSLDDLR